MVNMGKQITRILHPHPTINPANYNIINISKTKARHHPEHTS